MKTKSISAAYKRILRERGADELAERVYRDALNCKRPSDRLHAIQEITDRVEGKPLQALRLEQNIDAATARALVFLAEKLAGPVPQRHLLGTEETLEPQNQHVTLDGESTHAEP